MNKNLMITLLGGLLVCCGAYAMENGNGNDIENDSVNEELGTGATPSIETLAPGRNSFVPQTGRRGCLVVNGNRRYQGPRRTVTFVMPPAQTDQ